MTDYKNMKFRDDHEDDDFSAKLFLTSIVLAVSVYGVLLICGAFWWQS